MRLIYETHSSSTDNEIGVASGHNDPDLSATGERQAAELAERRTGEEIAAVYCSDLLRARRTAQIAFGDRRVPIITDARLRECDFGNMNGDAAEQVRAVSARHVTEPFPGGESYTDVVRRVRLFLQDASGQHGSATVLVIAHRAPHHALEHLLNDRDLAAVVNGDWQWQPGWVYELRR
jgi:alpha-ribazole phosphatase/probable phosphoglycerate mutase